MINLKIDKNGHFLFKLSNWTNSFWKRGIKFTRKRKIEEQQQQNFANWRLWVKSSSTHRDTDIQIKTLKNWLTKTLILTLRHESACAHLNDPLLPANHFIWRKHIFSSSLWRKESKGSCCKANRLSQASALALSFSLCSVLPSAGICASARMWHGALRRF